MNTANYKIKSSWKHAMNVLRDIIPTEVSLVRGAAIALVYCVVTFIKSLSRCRTNFRRS